VIGYERPPTPAGFHASVHDAEQAVEHAIRAGEKPEFEPLWRDYKPEFAMAQKSKCAFCDRNATTDDPDVDHFAPKAAVHELPAQPDDRGREIHDGLPNMRGRKPERAFAPGYWWRAYDWSNYLLVCGTCNSKWKQCYFPLDAPRQGPPVREVHESPLLLNAFDDQEPWRAFSFDEIGQIQGLDARGKATVETCGLDRETLRKERAGIVKDAYRHAREFRRRGTRYALQNLCELGGDERNFAGAVRAIAKGVTSLSWEQLCFLLHSHDWPGNA
jgi:hypothetical protein